MSDEEKVRGILSPSFHEHKQKPVRKTLSELWLSGEMDHERRIYIYRELCIPLYEPIKDAIEELLPAFEEMVHDETDKIIHRSNTVRGLTHNIINIIKSELYYNKSVVSKEAKQQ